MLLNAELLTMF